MEVIGKIEAAKYWEWRTLIEKRFNSQLKLDVASCRLQLMEKEMELMRLRANLYKNTEITSLKEKITVANTEYEDFRSGIEKDLNIELKDCVIDEISFEIKKLEE